MLEVLKALADASRLRLVAILLRGEFTVQELTFILNMGQSRVSWHLKILTEVGVLAVKRQGTWKYYRVSEENSFFHEIRPVCERALEHLPERSADLAAVAAVLERRRRRSLEFFDLHARQWDDLARTLLPVPDYRDRLLGLIPECGRIVEIGLGTGGLLSALAHKAKVVIGVDHSPVMLEEARRRIDKAGLAGIDLRLGEMTHLPLADKGADVVVLNMVLHHAPDPVAVLKDIRRVLGDSGELVMADLLRHEREAAREQLADQWLGFEEEELMGWLHMAGFGNVTCQPIAGGPGQESVLLVRGTKIV